MLRGHGRFNDVAFSQDDRWLASTSADGTIRFWRAPNFQEIAAEQAASLAHRARAACASPFTMKKEYPAAAQKGSFNT